MLRLQEAFALYQKGRWRESEAVILQIREPNAEALLLLAQVRINRGNWLGALNCLSTYDSRYGINPQLMVLKGNALRELDRFDDALEAYEQAIKLDVGFGPALANRAALRLLMGEVGSAEKDLLEAIRLNPDAPDANFLLGGVCLQRGDFETGWRLQERRLDTNLCPPLFRAYSENLRWSGALRDLTGKRLVVYGERGLGDVMQFARFLPTLIDQGVRLILQVPNTLHRLFSAVWPDIELADPNSTYQGEFDWHCPLESLPFLLKSRNPVSAQWLNIKHLQSKKLKCQIPKVGLVWSGMSVRDLERYTPTRRSMNLVTLAPIFCDEIDFVSLQPHTKPEDRDLMAQFAVQDLSGNLTDFYETAVLMQELDLVISIDTSVIHLAGALGVQAWAILPKVTDYRWSGSSKGSVWYPDVQIFRQTEAGDWSVPVREVGLALRQKFGLSCAVGIKCNYENTFACEVRPQA